MSLAQRKLEQRRSRALPDLLAFLTNQPPGEIVDACRRHVRQRAEINVARRLAARALDLQPWVIDPDLIFPGCRQMRKRFAHPLVRSMTGGCKADLGPTG